MKLFLTACFSLLLAISSFAQLENNPLDKKKDWKKIDLSKRPSDHFMLQFGYHGWANGPDSIRTTGFSNSFNVYLLFDFPFKSSPKLSVAVGGGLAFDNMNFNQTTIDLKQPQAVFFNKDTVNQFKRYKMGTGFFEIPLELRFSSNPENMNRGFKAAIGAKVGVGFNGYVMANVERDANGLGGYKTKEKDRTHFNTPRIAGTLRLGYGNFTAFGSYTFNTIFKDGRGPSINTWSVGLCFSGL
jgi:Outer membrane protein beta-barrel domain